MAIRFVFDWESSNEFFSAAQDQAKRAQCLERKCGAVVVKNNKIIGVGFNSPPKNLEKYRHCLHEKASLNGKVTDRTCCVHAERRAIIDAIRTATDITGSVIYFTSVDSQGNRLLSGEPYCTDCSKMALDEGVSEWVLEHKKRTMTVYPAGEYHEASFKYGNVFNVKSL